MVRIELKSSYQQPEIPEVRSDGAKHLHYGCEQDDILQVPEKWLKEIKIITIWLNRWVEHITVFYIFAV